MRRSNLILTPTICERTKPTDKKQTLWDGMALGLCLVVTPKVETGGGRKTWHFVARREGKQVWVRIGEYCKPQKDGDTSEVWTVDAARHEAGRLRKIHDQGQDVRAVVAEQRKPKTLEELANHYKASVPFRGLAQNTKDNETGMLKIHILPLLGKRLVGDIGTQEARELYATLEGAGKAATGNLCMTLLGKLLRYAERIGWRKEAPNPCLKVDRVAIQSRKRVLTADEYATIGEMMQRLVNLPASGVVKDDLDSILLLAYSGMRVGECLRLQWQHVDFDERKITITDHKTAKTMGAKVIPMNPQMEAVLLSRKSSGVSTIWTANPWVFPGGRVGTHRNETTLALSWIEIRTKAKLQDVNPHDLRRSFQTHGVELGFDVSVMERLLGHKLPGQQSTYIQLSPSGVMAEASAGTAAWIDAALNAKKPRTGARVGASVG